MAKDSVSASAAVVRQLTDKRLSDYDLHINVIGGGNIDGPSAGCAITCAILSAIEKKPLRQDIAITGPGGPGGPAWAPPAHPERRETSYVR